MWLTSSISAFCFFGAFRGFFLPPNTQHDENTHVNKHTNWNSSIKHWKNGKIHTKNQSTNPLFPTLLVFQNLYNNCEPAILYLDIYRVLWLDYSNFWPIRNVDLFTKKFVSGDIESRDPAHRTCVIQDGGYCSISTGSRFQASSKVKTPFQTFIITQKHYLIN